ncbi:MAG: RNA methyltransferase [Desulfovibrionaceae bacterium]|nr:RNA methyltransferase [Desulfovibrionaceae bacterium]
MDAFPLMSRLRLVLVRPRFPENIGMAARASANFGHAPLHLVQPERWAKDKALPLATSQGAPLLDGLMLHDSLAGAVAPCSLVLATTARTGGWRRQIISPRRAAAETAERLLDGEEAALVFGPEDRGLSNADLEHCGRLVTIPTAPGASSLNLAQAVLLMMYECWLALSGTPALSASQTARQPDARPAAPLHAAGGRGTLSRRVTRRERDLLDATLKRSLLDIGFLRPDNPDYFFLPLARFLDRSDLRRHELDILMGICRRMGRRRAGAAPAESPDEAAAAWAGSHGNASHSPTGADSAPAAGQEP